MRVHVQNDPREPSFRISADHWRAASERANEPPHETSFGETEEDFARSSELVELLVGPPAALRALPRLAAPRLQLVFVNAAGIDTLAPFDWLPERVALLNNRGTHGPKAGEYVAMAALMLASHFPALVAAQHAGRWQPIRTPVLAGRRALIVGTGDLGSAAARQLRGLGMHVTGVNTTGRPHADFDAVTDPAGLDAALPRADFLVLACPLTPATRGLADRRRLGLLPEGAGVVNIGRGRLLDQDALCDLLDGGHLGGAVLDVAHPEPLPPTHRLWRTKNLIVTPHVSCDDPATYTARSLAILFANLRAWRAGEKLPNRVDLARCY